MWFAIMQKVVVLSVYGDIKRPDEVELGADIAL